MSELGDHGVVGTPTGSWHVTVEEVAKIRELLLANKLWLEFDTIEGSPVLCRNEHIDCISISTTAQRREIAERGKLMKEEDAEFSDRQAWESE